MKRPPLLIRIVPVYIEPDSKLWIQVPLPNFLDTLPKLVAIKGRGRCLAGPPPSASAEEPAHA